jgi:hypothetical protein
MEQICQIVGFIHSVSARFCQTGRGVQGGGHSPPGGVWGEAPEAGGDQGLHGQGFKLKNMPLVMVQLGEILSDQQLDPP